jgi:hypothetical protein
VQYIALALALEFVMTSINCEKTNNIVIIRPHDQYITLYNNVLCSHVRIYKKFIEYYKELVGYKDTSTTEFYSKIYPTIYKTVGILPYNPYPNARTTKDQITLFAPRNIMDKFIESSTVTNKLLNTYYKSIFGNSIPNNNDNLLKVSILDLYKMYLQSSTVDNNYQYIFQTDPNTLNTLCNIVKVMQILPKQNKASFNTQNNSYNKVPEFSLESLADRKLSVNTPKYIFVPYIPDNNDSLCKSKVVDLKDLTNNIRFNFSILDENEFVNYLKRTLNKEDVGNIIFQFLDKIKINYAFNELELEYRIGYFPTYGLDKEEIEKLLSVTNEYYLHYMNQSKKIIQPVTSLLCNTVYNKLIDTLGTANNILKNYDMFTELYDLLSGCNFKLQNLDTLKDNYLATGTYETCKKRIAGPHDSINGSIIVNCNDILKKIEDVELKNSFEKRLIQIKESNSYSNSENLSRSNIFTSVQAKDMTAIQDYDLFLDSMPEWIQYIKAGNYQGANESRQLILGKLFNETILDYHLGCSLIFQVSPFVHNKFMNMLRWNPFINKYMIACLTQKNVIFPIRIVANVSDLIKYPRFVYNPIKHILLGTIITNLPELSRQDQMFIYYDKVSKILNYVNFRGNFAYHYASAGDSYMVTYIELTLLMYYESDLGIKLYYYRIRNASTIDNVLVSKFNIDQIREQYKLLNYSDENINKILSRLEPVTLERDAMKNFYYAKSEQVIKPFYQKGGKVKDANESNVDIQGLTKNDLEFDKLINLEPSDFTFGPKFSTNNKVINKQVFPRKLLRKYIKTSNKLVKLLGDKYGYLCAVLSKRIFLGTYGRDIYATKDNKTDIDNVKNTLGSKKLADLVSVFYENEMESILKYRFNDVFSIEVYVILKEENLITDTDKICVISKNVKLLDGILYYLNTYYPDSDIKNNIDFTLSKLNSAAVVVDNSIDYLKKQKINYTILESSTKDLVYSNKTVFSIVFIDYIMFIKELSNFRTNIVLQGLISCLVATLPHLITTGTLYLYVPMITNKLALDFLVYLSTNFESSKIITISPETKCTPSLMTIILKEYKGTVDIEELSILRDLLNKYDDMDGINFEPNNTEEREYFGISYSSPNKPKEYLTKIFKSKPDLSYFHYAYKTYITNIINSQLAYAKTIKHINKLDSKTFNEQYLANALTHSLGLAIKYDLQINDKFKDSNGIKKEYLKLLQVYK